jgi:rhodanese-related sulfurtransferase
MPTPIDRARVQRLMATGAQIVEVLPADDYARLHLPGAINIPLKELDARGAARLRGDVPIVTYCHDFQ